MLKRVLMMGLIMCVGLATRGGRSAEADDEQWVFVAPPGMWWFWGSVNGCADITRVPNPKNHPAQLRCDVDLTRIEVLCYNPKNKDVTPGVAGAKVVLAQQIEPSDLLEKDRGRANVCLGINELTLGSALCNRNWKPQVAITTDFLATCVTEECTDSTCSNTRVANTKVCSCTLPGASLSNPPSFGDPYSCVELNAVTGQPTGATCQLQ